MASIKISSVTVNQIIRERVEQSNHVLEYADNCRKTGVHTDICLKTGTKSFRAHRLILSCYSVYFRSMFRTEMQEKYVNAVNIEGVDATSLESLIDFIYAGKICINQENVFDLLVASDYLQINEAKQFCFDFMFDVISVETCLNVLKMADLYQDDDLLNKTVQYIINHLAEISTTNDFKCQTKDDFLDLLTRLKSYRVEQRLVYDAMIGWVKHNESREHDFIKLFQRLDLSKLSSSFLANTVSIETLVIENHLCSNLVMKTFAMKFQESASTNPSKVLSLGGWGTPNKVFVVYNNDQTDYPALPQRSFNHCSLKVDNFVYCIGGGYYNSTKNKVWKMQLYETNMKWEEVASMEVGRMGFGAAVYKDGIGVAGGYSQDAKHSAEFFIVSLNQWSALPSMNEDRFGHALVTCNDCLFCLGGRFDDKSCLSSVEMLSDVSETWQRVQPMQTPRYLFTAVNCMNNIYAVGGSNNQHDLIKSVEKYDSKTNKWIYVKEMNMERRGHSACVMQDKIYVVGGINASDEFVSEIECYDPLSDNWSIVGKTNERLVSHSVIAI